MIDSRSSDSIQSHRTAVMIGYRQVILLKDGTVVHYESKLQPKYKCLLMGIIWKFTPAFRFNKRDFIIVD
jgi:hypothetical protein